MTLLDHLALRLLTHTTLYCLIYGSPIIYTVISGDSGMMTEIYDVKQCLRNTIKYARAVLPCYCQCPWVISNPYGAQLIVGVGTPMMLPEHLFATMMRLACPLSFLQLGLQSLYASWRRGIWYGELSEGGTGVRMQIATEWRWI